MSRSQQLATRFREVMLNGFWIANTNYKKLLSDTDWQQATTKVSDLNTIALLTFHINYYIAGVADVFAGGKLAIRDKHSFELPPIESAADWEQLKNSLFENSERFAKLVEAMSEKELELPFANSKYGTNDKNIDAMIEHSYYHMGQVVLIRKLLKSGV
ncbi:MAG: DUF1572 domain-containing protein [Saprospiraceae bacterium]